MVSSHDQIHHIDCDSCRLIQYKMISHQYFRIYQNVIRFIEVTTDPGIYVTSVVTSNKGEAYKCGLLIMQVKSELISQGNNSAQLAYQE